MKKFLGILFVFFLLVSCKSSKEVVDTGNIKKLSARKVIKNHSQLEFSGKTVDAKLGIQYTDFTTSKRKRHGLAGRLRMEIDSAIWIRGTYKLVTAFKAKITPTTFSYYLPTEKMYYEGDFASVKEILGVDVSFQQLQSLFLGETLLDLESQKFSSEIAENSYQLSPKKQQEIFDIFFFFNPINFSVKKQLVKVKNSEKTLRVEYNNGYIKEKEQLFPKELLLIASEGEKYTNIDIRVKSLSIDVPIKMPYRINPKYKRIELK